MFLFSAFLSHCFFQIIRQSICPFLAHEYFGGAALKLQPLLNLPEIVLHYLCPLEVGIHSLRLSRGEYVRTYRKYNSLSCLPSYVSPEVR